MSQKILQDVEVRSSSPYYGTLEISDIHYEDGSIVPIKNFLGITLLSPVEVLREDVNPQLTPWARNWATISNKQIQADEYSAAVKVTVYDHPYSITPSSRIIIGISGDLITDPKKWTDSVALFADNLPNDSSAHLLSRLSLLQSPIALTGLVSQPARFAGAVGATIRKGLGCCLGRDKSDDEKLPGEISLKY